MSIREKIDDNFLYYYLGGLSTDSYNIFGAHLNKNEKDCYTSCEFTLYAPNAKSVEIIGEWNDFNPGTFMDRITPSGVFNLTIEGNLEWKRYKYLIKTFDNKVLYKADPYAFYSQIRPCTDSKICDLSGYKWSDDNWMYTHPKVYDKPVLIYELHLGSWKRKGVGEDDFYSFTELAPMLVEYLKNYGYTHVEILPVYEHPLDASWGYQGTSYYAITPRYGSPKDFMYFVDYLHQAGYGVIMDWVPGHICKDAHGLYMFDGTPLYEYPDESIRENKEWGTANLDLGKGLTKSFLYSNALFYKRFYHVDGFRVDAVSNIIYYLGDSSRGTNEGATGFIKELSKILFKEDDRLIFMAEDSSSFPGVTKPVDAGGLGFNFKWDLGWMNDTLKYFKLDPIYRKFEHNKLTFSMMYYYNEQFVLPFSHDEVVHMKGSILNKMPGDYWQQFANYRLLIGYMMTHPGKKLLFMGDELPTYDEWHYEGQLTWDLNKFPAHDSANRYVKELTKFYKEEKALFELDYAREGFSYIDADNKDQSMYIYARFAANKDDHLVIIMNCTPNTYRNYRIGVPGTYSYKEVINSDKDIYGGSNVVNSKKLMVVKECANNQNQSIYLDIPPLGIVILKNEVKKVRAKKVEASASKTKKN